MVRAHSTYFERFRTNCSTFQNTIALSGGDSGTQKRIAAQAYHSFSVDEIAAKPGLILAYFILFLLTTLATDNAESVLLVLKTTYLPAGIFDLDNSQLPTREPYMAFSGVTGGQCLYP